MTATSLQILAIRQEILNTEAETLTEEIAILENALEHAKSSLLLCIGRAAQLTAEIKAEQKAILASSPTSLVTR